MKHTIALMGASRDVPIVSVSVVSAFFMSIGIGWYHEAGIGIGSFHEYLYR
jgi:uncharacterized membrane protein YbjE (DUF340 family)